MDVPAELKKKVEAEVLRCVKLARKHYNKDFIVPAIRYTVRGTCAGYAQGVSLVDFNAVLLVENQEEFLKSTVPHEVAHCIDAACGRVDRVGITVTRTGRLRRAKREVHGPSWKAIMRLFGADPDRTHNYDTSRAQVRVKQKFEYKCSMCGSIVTMSSVVHNRMQRGSNYWHKPCGKTSRLVFVANLGKKTSAELQEIRDQRITDELNQEQEQRLAAQTQRPTKEVPVSMLLPKREPQGNMAIAKGIMARYGYNLTRQQFIVRAVEAGLKATTASTYYNQLRPKGAKV